MYAGLRISNTLHKKSRCIGPGLCRTSEKFGNANFGEFPFRNCLEIRNGSRIGAQIAAKRGQRSPDQLPLGAIEECSRCLLLFSKQFLQALG